MNKSIILRYGIIATLLLAVMGCNEWLEDVQPATEVEGHVVLSSADGVLSLRTSMYSQLRKSDFSTNYLIGPSAMADETRARPSASRMVALNDAVGTHGTAHLSSYTQAYSIIQDANLLIEGVEEGVLDEATLNQYQGEAYAFRAYAMHHLVRALGYEPGNYDQGPESNWDLGIIIRTNPTYELGDVDERPRATVDQVYDQILSDLEEAKRLLAGRNDDNTFVTEAFVDGLTARVNLYAGNWAAASDAAQEAITNSGRELIDTEEGISIMFRENLGGTHPEAIFKQVIHPNTEPLGVTNAYAGANVNDSPSVYTSTQWVAQVPTQFVIDLYDEDDYRLSGWYQPCFNSQTGQPVNDCVAINDAGLSTNKWNGGKGNMADDIPRMRVAEMYLIWAEAAAKAANSPAAGLAPLQELRDARNAGIVPPAALLSLEAFEDEILNERVRELVVEGHRFWDLKRLGRHITEPNGDVKIRHDSYRILAQIGAAARSVNNELIENPGY